MSAKNKKRKSQKVVKESKSESLKTKCVHDVVDSCDLQTNNVTLISPLTVSKALDCKSTSKMRERSTKQSTSVPKDDINPDSSTLENDVKWCIAQLEMAIVNKSIPKKQKEESMKYIKLLQSSKTPVPRKRQIMRQNFGDYKQKMRERPLLDRDITVKVADSELMVSAGKFHRKSAKFKPDSCTSDEQGAIGGGLEHPDNHTLRDLCKELESTSFAFNFSVD